MHLEIDTQKSAPKKQLQKFSTFRLFWTSILYQAKEFFSNSTLHGVRYIAEVGRPFGERFMWFCFTATGAVSALIIIVSLWEKFQTNPTITGLDTDFHNQQVIFPTIVVCPTVPYDANRTNQLASTILSQHNPEKAERLQPLLELLTKLSYSNIVEVPIVRLQLTQDDLNQFNQKKSMTLRSMVFKSHILCEDLFDICKYKDEDIGCCEHFFPVYTEHGFCYAFNGRYTDSATMEYRNKTFHDLFETDKKWALLFMPQIKSRIYVHSNNENFGYDFRPQIIWEPLYTAELLISMKQTYTTEDARQLSIVQRKCIFPDEIKLDIYDDEYTFTSCMKECRIKKCMKFCKCIPPFYKPLNHQPYCTLEQFDCLAKHVKNITDVRDCSQCELSCSNTVYDIEKLSEIGQESYQMEKYINIEYLTWPIIRYKREVLFGWVDLLVSFGGIAGLFLGFSLLSGVEIIYYFTMRACCMLYKNRNELSEIEEEKLLETQRRYNLDLKIYPNRNMEQNKKIKLVTTAKDQKSGDDHVMTITMSDNLILDATKSNQLDNGRPARLNRANLKLQAARELVKSRYRPIKVKPAVVTRNKLPVEPGQYDFIN